MIEDVNDTASKATSQERPRWLLPALAGVIIGALVGSLIAGRLPPSSSVASQASAAVRTANPTITLPPETPRPPMPTVRQPPAAFASPGSFPPVLKPARIFAFQARAGTAPLPPGYWSPIQLSRYVLYEDGTFALQYAVGDPPLEDHGSYEEALGRIDFGFFSGDASGGTSWAYAFLEGNFLTVRYGYRIGLSDYEDAVYVGR